MRLIRAILSRPWRIHYYVNGVRIPWWRGMWYVTAKPQGPFVGPLTATFKSSGPGSIDSLIIEKRVDQK